MRRPRRFLRRRSASGRRRQQLGGGPSGSCSSGLARCGSAVRWSKAEPLVHLQPHALGWPAEGPPVCACHRGAQRQAAAGCPRSDRALQARHQGSGERGRLGRGQGRGGGWRRRRGAGAGLGGGGRGADGAAGGGGGGAAGAAGGGAGEGGERVGARGPQSPHSRLRRRQWLCRHWQLRQRHPGRGKHRRQPPPAAAPPEGAALAAASAALSLGSVSKRGCVVRSDDLALKSNGTGDQPRHQREAVPKLKDFKEVNGEKTFDEPPADKASTAIARWTASCGLHDVVAFR